MEREDDEAELLVEAMLNGNYEISQKWKKADWVCCLVCCKIKQVTLKFYIVVTGVPKTERELLMVVML